jgi:hypothetical protein
MSDSRLDDSFMSDSSDDEQVSELRDWAATDFWLGKKYFELSLLRCIIKDHPCCEPTTLEVSSTIPIVNCAHIGYSLCYTIDHNYTLTTRT